MSLTTFACVHPSPWWVNSAPADLFSCRLVRSSVCVSERPIERGDVDTAAGLAHQIEPRLEDGGVGGAGVKLQPFRDALHQNDPDRGRRRSYSYLHLYRWFCL